MHLGSVGKATRSRFFSGGLRFPISVVRPIFRIQAIFTSSAQTVDVDVGSWALAMLAGVGIDARLYEMNAFPMVFVLTSADKAHMQYEFVVPRTFQCVHQMYSFYAMFLFGLMDFKRNVHRRARSRK